MKRSENNILVLLHVVYRMLTNKQKGACLYAIAGYGLLLYLFYFYISIFFNQARLHLYGEKTKGVVTKVWIHKAYTCASYEFEVNGIKYQGDFGKCPDDAAVGDTVSISFLPSNPEYNMIIKE